MNTKPLSITGIILAVLAVLIVIVAYALPNLTSLAHHWQPLSAQRDHYNIDKAALAEIATTPKEATSDAGIARARVIAKSWDVPHARDGISSVELEYLCVLIDNIAIQRARSLVSKLSPGDQALLPLSPADLAMNSLTVIQEIQGPVELIQPLSQSFGVLEKTERAIKALPDRRALWKKALLRQDGYALQSIGTSIALVHAGKLRLGDNLLEDSGTILTVSAPDAIAITNEIQHHN